MNRTQFFNFLILIFLSLFLLSHARAENEKSEKPTCPHLTDKRIERFNESLEKFGLKLKSPTPSCKCVRRGVWECVAHVLKRRTKTENVECGYSLCWPKE